MSKLNSKRFLELVERSRLVESDQLARTLGTVRKAAAPERLEDSAYLGAKLVEAELLTRWQCDKLLDGRHKGFFLGKYKLLGHLGAGGMSNVYLAEHVLMQRRVAIKVLPQSKVHDSSYWPASILKPARQRRSTIRTLSARTIWTTTTRSTTW